MTKRREKFIEERENYPLLKALTENQTLYLDALENSPQTVVIGCAGTGKTFLAASKAADEFRLKHKRKIVLTRPNIPSGRSLGFFPGTMEEKFAEWVRPFTEVIQQRMHKGMYDIALKTGGIECVPFEVMRGRTFDDAFIILDEAQNTTPEEMKMFLTRIGKGSQVVVNGDIEQSDLKATSGLYAILKMIEKYKIPVPIIEFNVSDIVRSDLCALWVRAFHKEKI